MLSKLNSAKTWLWSGVALAVIGLGFWGFNQYRLLTKYCYKIKSVKFTSISYTKLAFVLNISLRNFSNIKASITSVKLDIYFDDIKMTTINSNKETVLVQNGVSNLAFNVSVNPKSILTTDFVKLGGLINALIGDKSKVKVTMRGTAGIKVGLVDIKKLDIDMTMTMAEMLADNPNAFVCDIL